jgi:hypothetical protein
VPSQGLEVAADHGLEAAHDQGLELVVPNSYYNTSALRLRRSFRRKRIWVTGLTIVVLVVVLGAVLGSELKPRGRNKRHGGRDATPTPSPLAAISWTLDDGNSGTKLIYQDNTGLLQDSTYQSSTKSWTKVSNFAKAKKGSPLAMTQFNNTVREAQRCSSDTFVHINENFLGSHTHASLCKRDW